MVKGIIKKDAFLNFCLQVGEIQNPGLGEFKIRDLNDEINKLLREKGHWERRIKDLGGPNYLVSLLQS
jgi:hypothetical protein